MLVAPPGAGKSTLGIALAVAAATGGSEIVGETVHETIKAWVWNNEDDRNELRRRLGSRSCEPMERRARRSALAKHGLNSGSERPLVVAKATKDGAVVRLPDIEAIIERVQAEGVGLPVVDPFVETHEVDENNNAQIKAVAAMWREVAWAAGIARLSSSTHAAKPPSASPDAWTGSLSASRGASSRAGIARIMRTLFAMSQSDADKFGLDADERRLWVRLDDAKANLSLASGSARWFKRVSVTIANGEGVGALVPGDPNERAPQQDRAVEIESALFEAIRAAWNAGAPLSEQPRAKDRYALGIVGKALRVAAETVADVLARLMGSGAIERTLFDAKNKIYGLRIVPLDERDMRGAGRIPEAAEEFE